MDAGQKIRDREKFEKEMEQRCRDVGESIGYQYRRYYEYERQERLKKNKK